MHFRKVKNPPVLVFQVPLTGDSLNDGDAFLLDDGGKIYTWFGANCSPFEKSRAANLAFNMAENRFGRATVIPDVGNDDDDFWALLGGKTDVKTAESFVNEHVPSVAEISMYILSHSGGALKISQVSPSRENLRTGDVCVVDAGQQVFVWVGRGSSLGEQQQTMLIIENYLKENRRTRTTSVTRVLEGQEHKCTGFEKTIQ